MHLFLMKPDQGDVLTQSGLFQRISQFQQASFLPHGRGKLHPYGQAAGVAHQWQGDCGRATDVIRRGVGGEPAQSVQRLLELYTRLEISQFWRWLAYRG